MIWHVLTEQASDRHADAAAIGRRFARWGSRYGLTLSMSPDRLIFLQQTRTYVGLDAAASCPRRVAWGRSAAANRAAA